MSKLDEYMNQFPPLATFEETWPIQGSMTVNLGLASELPPAEVSSSILSIIHDQQKCVCFLWPDQSINHIAPILIGGRPEPGETNQETAQREAAEEVGWEIQVHGLIGYRHFHQHEAFNPESDRQHPDFVQPIYAAKAIKECNAGIIESDYIQHAWIKHHDALARIDETQRFLLQAALQNLNL